MNFKKSAFILGMIFQVVIVLINQFGDDPILTAHRQLRATLLFVVFALIAKMVAGFYGRADSYYSLFIGFACQSLIFSVFCFVFGDLNNIYLILSGILVFFISTVYILKTPNFLEEF